MDNAWLDSLSEDWISQPRSAGSPVGSLPSLSGSVAQSLSSQSRNIQSRIPLPTSQKQPRNPQQGGNSLPLGERSPNTNNIPSSQRGSRRQSKLRNKIVNAGRERRLSRTVSGSSTGSTKHHTVQHRSQSASPQKAQFEEEPEWRKRLLHGEIAYGEQCELFSSAGLENLFKPPTQTRDSTSQRPIASYHKDDSSMPSSPPCFAQESRVQASLPTEVGGIQERKTTKSQAMKYTRAVSDGGQLSEDDLSQTSSFPPALSTTASRPSTGKTNATSSGSDEIRPPGSRFTEIRSERVSSGQSDVRHEDLSPIYLSRHNTVGGNIDYAALDGNASELQKRLQALNMDSLVNDLLESSRVQGNDESSLLPIDATGNTEDFAHNGKYVNLGRGGRSFEGSFRRTMLSPSSLPLIDESLMLQDESVQASTPKQLDGMRKTRPAQSKLNLQQDAASPIIPAAPNPSPAKEDLSSSRPGTGSPLKLFGIHDTFTNQTLLRRLSQFENTLEDSFVEFPNAEGSQGVESAHHTEMDQAYVTASSPQKMFQNPSDSIRSRNISMFGDGDLDHYAFSQEVSSEPSHGEGSELEDRDQVSHDIFKFHLQPSPVLHDGPTRHRKVKSITTTREEHVVTTTRGFQQHRATRSADFSADSDLHVLERSRGPETPRKVDGDAQGKRLLRSPQKDPTPKRRRTLHKTDVDNPIPTVVDSVQKSHQSIQSVLGKKRKDARHENNQQSADAQVMATRQVLRPRNSTPSRRGSMQSKSAAGDDEGPMTTQQLKIAKIQAEWDATEAFTMGASMQSEIRKPSVTTQDFLEEAQKIMAGIRSKARSGLTSVEESESENDKNTGATEGSPEPENEDSFEESTQEPFSRPPSREGGGPFTRPQKQQDDPQILSHLKKWEEMGGDLEMVMASSMKSISMAKQVVKDALEVSQAANETISKTTDASWSQAEEYQSDPPNIQITEYPELQRKRKHSTSSLPIDGTKTQEEYNSQGSNSSGPSTAMSFPTSSSTRSEKPQVITSKSVAHLIPKELAGMVYDKEKETWVRRKDQAIENLHSDDPDYDPFCDIPDLTVDETQELERIKAVAARQREEARISHVQPYQGPKPANSRIVKVSTTTEVFSEEVQTITTSTKLGNGGRETVSHESHQQATVHKEVNLNVPDTEEADGPEDVEQEISIHESRMATPPRARRNITISFSSPLASIIQSHDYTGVDSDTERQELPRGQATDKQGSSKSRNFSIKSRSGYDSVRKGSRGAHTFVARPVSRIEEREEESFLDRLVETGQRAVSVVISTPNPERSTSREVSILQPGSAAYRSDAILELSPLSEFTINQAEESFAFEVSYIGRRDPTPHGGRRSMTLSVKDLVQQITDIEPYEPFWEHMKEINLSQKRLQTLHMLSKFCAGLEVLDISRNEIGQLDGIPGSIRHLHASHNHLSDLTSWDLLHNLQYLDLSNNDLTSLAGLKDLVHLRSVRADNNSIVSVNGVTHLDGLISLRLRNNPIETVDFEGSALQRLTDLDFKGSRIRSVCSLHTLTALTVLNLEDNELADFSGVCDGNVWNLKYLKLSGNQLERIDVSQYPNLRLLYLDGNRLGSISGLHRTKHLDSLSMREQQAGSTIDPTFLDDAFEVRKLFLSGNLLTTFTPQTRFLNLQYLELANCGLQELPEKFGQMMCNVRVLNLNFNAIHDLEPLFGIMRLKKLHVAGNRVRELHKTTAVLSEFLHLTVADLRNNPLTQGFYPLLKETRMVLQGEPPEGQIIEPFTLDDGDVVADKAYARRLDMGTKMLRRVFEMLLLGGCARLRMLDGLPVDRASLKLRDNVWDELVKVGVVECDPLAPAEEGRSPKQDIDAVGAEEQAPAVEREEVWGAEDSFA